MASSRADAPFVAHTVGGLHPRLGGPARTVSQLTASLAANGACRIVSLSQGKKGENVVSVPAQQLERRIGLANTRFSLDWGLALKNVLHELITDQCLSLLHGHGIWMPSNHYVASAARKYGIPRFFQLSVRSDRNFYT